MAYVATLTIPAATVASSLTDFVTRVDLSHLPAGWWTDTTSDLGNVRVKAAGTVVPFDIVWYDRTAKTGELFFKAPLSTSDNVFTIETVDGATALAATDTNGRNAVWSDYALMWSAAQPYLNRVNGNAQISGESIGTVSAVTTGGLAAFTSSDRIHFAVPKYTTWTVGLTVTWPSDTGTSRGAVNYNALGSTGDTNREVVGTHSGFVGADNIGAWNSTDTWVEVTGGSVVPGNRDRVNFIHRGTTSRTVYVRGQTSSVGLSANDNTVAQRPGGTGDVISIGGRVGDSASGRWADGIGYVYLRSGDIGDDWRSAEYVSWETPSSFYTITSGGAIEGTLSPTLPLLQASFTGSYAHLDWAWTGAVTDDGFTVSAKVGPNVSVELGVEAGDLSSLSSPTYGSPVTADSDGYVKVSVSGLSAATTYTYGLRLDGDLATDLGHVTTFPTSGSAASFSFAHASCMDSNTNHRVFDSIAAKDPLFFLQLGDLHYADYNGTTAATRRGHYDAIFAQARPKALWQAVPVPYIWDDHDFCGNNSAGSATGKATAQSVFRQVVPHYPLDHANDIYHWFMVGRVAFIVTDLRSERSADGATDNSSKTMMGATQKAWFKDTLLDADAAGAVLIVWVSTNVYSGHGTTGINFDNDQWAAFTTERTELADYIRDQGLVDKVLIVSGDAHMIAHDDGSNADFATGGGAPLQEFVAAALDRPGIQRGDHWSSGAYPNSGGNGQYAVFDFTDNGDTIDYQWTAYSVNATTGADTTVLSLSGTYPPQYSGTLDATTPLTEAAFDGTYIPPDIAGTFAVDLPTISADFTGTWTDPNPTSELAATLPALAAGFSGTYTPATITGSLAATVPTLSVSLTGDAGNEVGSIAPTVPLLVARFDGAYLGPFPTDTSNLFTGLNLGGLGYVTQSTPTVAAPAVDLGTRVDAALPYPQPVMDNGRPT